MKKMRNTISLFAILLLLSGCVSIPTGSGEKISVSKDGVEIEGKDGEKAKIDMDTKDGGYTITSGDGDVSQVGSHAEIPERFPKDILLPDSQKLMLASESLRSQDQNYNSFMLSYTMDDDMEESVEMYHNYLTENGFEVEEFEFTPEMRSLNAEKDGNKLTYQFMKGSNKSTYTFSVLYLDYQ